MLLLLVVSAAGCGYRFTADSGTRLSSGQQVWVSYFENRTVHVNASVYLKRALFEQFEQQRGIVPAASVQQGDLLVEGRILGYGAGAVSYSAADTAKEYRLTITAELTVRRRGEMPDARPLWKGTLSAWQDYPAAAQIEMQRSSEDAALLAASRKLAQQVIWHLEQQY